MRRTIKIIDYGIDSGYGQVDVEYNNGKVDQDIIKKSFSSLGNALLWLLNETGGWGDRDLVLTTA